MCDFLINVLATVAGGLFLTLILFTLNEYVFRKPNLNGEWEVEEIIKSSSRTDIEFTNYKLKFVFHLLLKGYEISGSGEKISETEPGKKEFFFQRAKRVNVTISGYLERKYLGKNTIYFHVIENGRLRDSRTTFTIKRDCLKKNKYKGTFISTAADASGSMTMKKTR